MVAFVIDPIVCQSSVWWMFPECWGIAVMVGVGLLALTAAVARRQLAVRVR